MGEASAQDQSERNPKFKFSYVQARINFNFCFRSFENYFEFEISCFEFKFLPYFFSPVMEMP
jgi:hypothetical protein